MRSEAATACCRLAFTRDSFLIGPYIRNRAATNDVNSPAVSRPCAISRLPYHSAPAMARPPRNSINGGSIDRTRVTFRLVRNSAAEARSNFVRLAPLGAKGLDDAVAGERLAGDMRHVLLRLLAPARHRAHAFAEAHERIHHQRRRGHAHQRQLGVVVEQQRGRPDQRQRLARQVADRFRHGALHQADVVVDARQQLPGRAAREERRRLIEQVPEQLVAHDHHHAVAEAFHQVTREIAAQALERSTPIRMAAAMKPRSSPDGSTVVDDGLDQIRHRRGRRPVHDHRQRRAGDHGPVRGRVAKEAQKSVHQESVSDTLDTPSDGSNATAMRAGR